MYKIKLIIMMALLVIATTLVGCGKDVAPGVDKGQGDTVEVVVETDAKNEIQETLEPKDIIFDLVSAVDSQRAIEEVEKYPAYTLLEAVVDKDAVENGQKAAEDGTKTEEVANTTDTTTENKVEKVEIQYVNPERVKKFFEDTGTTSDDYLDLYIAHYPENNYTVGIVIPAEGKDNVLKSINYYKDKLYDDANEDMKDYYEKAVVLPVKGCIIISISDRADVYAGGMDNYIQSIYSLLNVTATEETKPVVTETEEVKAEKPADGLDAPVSSGVESEETIEGQVEGTNGN